MLSWLVRLVVIAAGGIVGLFMAEESPSFGLYQAMVSLLLVVLVVFVGAFWPQRWSHFLDRLHRKPEN